jgi:hypothetical protein
MDPNRFRANQQINNLPPSPRDDFSQPSPPDHYIPPKKVKKSKWWVGVVILVVVVIIGAGAWLYSSSHKTPPKKIVASKKIVIKPKKVVSTQNLPVIPSSSHTSVAYGLTFSYPTSWNVVDSGSAPLLVTSPVMNLIADTGKTELGQIVLTISQPNLLPPGFTATSVAVLNSQKLAYTKPTAVQAADTYISFVQYPSTTVVGGLNGIYVSGNYGYQKDQQIPASNINQINPLIYFSFYSCASSACPLTTRQPLTISISQWNNASFKDPILLILKSLSFS